MYEKKERKEEGHYCIWWGRNFIVDKRENLTRGGRSRRIQSERDQTDPGHVSRGERGEEQNEEAMKVKGRPKCQVTTMVGKGSCGEGSLAIP